MKKVFEGTSSWFQGGRWLPWIFPILFLLGCGEDPQQLLETAQFEEQQGNRPHAQELYERIVRDHPASSQAERARDRIEALRKEQP